MTAGEQYGLKNDRKRPFFVTAAQKNDRAAYGHLCFVLAAVIFNEPQVFWSAVTNFRDSYSAA